MMVHGFGDERNARHIAERADEILARKLAVQLAVDQIPTLGFGKQRCNLGFGKFFCRHVAFLQDRVVFSPAIMRCNWCASNNAGSGRTSCWLCERCLQRFFVDCAREFHYRRGFSRDKNTRCVSLFWWPQAINVLATRRAVNVLATTERSTPQRDGERSEKENSRHPVWCRPDRRIDCAIDAGKAGD